MAKDGSFKLHFELARFLARCPRVSVHQEFESLLKKGENVREDEVVRVLGVLFLHQKYTILVVGCFRPLMDKIMKIAVELLKNVHSGLRSNSNLSSLMEESDECKFLIEVDNLDSAELFHALSLHEIACLAFCRALDMVPSLLRHVLMYFKFAPPPFERIKLMQSSSNGLPTIGISEILLNVVRTSYRFLLPDQAADREVFRTLWDWSCFLDFGHLLHNIDQFDDGLHKRNIMDLRWCGLQILSSSMNMPDKASSEHDIGPVEACFCLQRWLEFREDVSLERASWYNEFSGAMSVAEFSADESNVTGSFVLTAALKKSFEMVFLAVNQKWPVLLHGPPGSGKTALINKLAQDKKCQVLSIHMDEHFDGKTLLGGYVCTEQPGEFKWQPGSLTQAVSRGFWVIFEDIDKAPADVHAILLPLLEGSSSFLTGHGEAIRVDEGFRLFSTLSSSKLDGTEGKISLSGQWRRVSVASPGDEDLVNIVNKWFPKLDSLTGRIIETFNQMNHLSGCQYRGSHSRFSSRDLLKWCRRISGLLDEDAPSFKAIYKEAVDVFAAYSSTAENWLALMNEIARLWGVMVQPVNKPEIKDSLGILCSRIQIQLDFNNVALSQYKKQRLEVSGSEEPLFAEISTSVHTLERIACSVKFNEPVLLVGETGTGKTTLVQNLATRVGQKLTVLNLSQQSDAADLLGGFQPSDVHSKLVLLYNEYESLITDTFREDNWKHLNRLKDTVVKKHWGKVFEFFRTGIDAYRSKRDGKKRKRPLDTTRWERFILKQETAHALVSSSGGMIFSFVEGAFVQALRNGDWILLDEVNLAPPEVLQRLIGVLEGGSMCLSERGDIDYVSRHPNFRIFACMNPATDAGKRDLPMSVRGRFTEYYVDDVLSDDDLYLFIEPYLAKIVPTHDLNQKIVKILKFYKAAKKESEERLQDGATQKPQYSLRSLSRALQYTMKAMEARREGCFQKALYDGFCMFFKSLLDEASSKLMNQMIVSYMLEGKVPREIDLDAFLSGRKLVPLSDPESNAYLESYIMTKSVQKHLNILARAVLDGKYPVLLQGPTSSGKTSLVKYLAAKTGNKFVRINNHEHTDLQEYLGSYITDSQGKLVFQKGALVKAVEEGHWIVLDELNLAPSDVLEALNRLLDDNRQLYVPELHEYFYPHANFALFATQNPPNAYGGRKILSRAFRNRFVEIQVDEIPQNELATILVNKCEVPPSYAEIMVNVMKDLQKHRQSSMVFAGKEGYITPRDLFRWAGRYKKLGNSKEDLARDGYYLLAERLREESEREVVRKVLKDRLKYVHSEDNMYNLDAKCVDKITWTRSMRRLYFLVERCYKLKEPVLLVGETGGGKTTVCQLLSLMNSSKLHILNCHQYTETSDFIGGFFPVRERSAIMSEYKELCQGLNSKAHEYFISSDINDAPQALDKLSAVILSDRKGQMLPFDVPLEDLRNISGKLHELHNKWQSIFVWQDGPLIEAIKNGDMFLVDEISLADDSVLERLNSVLEPERKLSLAEKGGPVLEDVAADGNNFFLLATMNPGGDYGKKELSPALRNRFTEIWVPSITDLDELRCIGLEKISDKKLAPFVDVMVKFWDWFNNLETGRMLTVRDFLSWVAFVNLPEELLKPEHALIHGAFLVLLDGLNLGTHLSKADAAQLRKKSLEFLLGQLKAFRMCFDHSTLSSLEYYGWSDPDTSAYISGLDSERRQCDNLFGIHPFYIEKGNDDCHAKGFEFSAPTTRRNALRVLRAMQLAKPALLEGSPGVGKTSLIVAIGKYSGHNVVRINLSEQTDMMDLLGSDLPVESDQGIQFAWCDGILLQALKMGSWVLLDELNLAPQSVLEGLNSILDHRAEVFIPELGQTFECPPSFRIFACQNPTHQGGGRKGLPKSFLNRFTKVYVDELSDDDYMSICMSRYPSIPCPILGKLITFNKRLHEETMLHHKFAQDGSPWEFNLRDVDRSCEMIQGALEVSKEDCFLEDCFLDTVYVKRMRTATDRLEVVKLYEQVFGRKPHSNSHPRLQLNPRYLVVGNTSVKRNPYQACGYLNSQLKPLPGILSSLEAVSNCIRHKWLCILVGPPSRGKTSLVRLLAQLTGNVLHEVNLSPATDTSELLGCFEQRDGKFRWTTGVLVDAITKGEWIVLDNANLCNPTVLDRINSLVEQSGSITLNECGIVDGKPVVLHPDAQFRMFLTVNPSSGEVSRAMRNRGVEIYLMESSDDDEIEEAQLREAKRFIVLLGVPHGRLVDMMSKAHVYAKNEGAKLGARITLLELDHWVQLFKQLIASGNQPIWSLQVSWEHTYSSPLGEDTGKIAQAILTAAENLRTDQFQDSWPTPLNMRDYVLYSRETCVRRNCMYLEYLGKSLEDDKRLFFAANWAMEQAVESDVELYLCWLSWFGSTLGSFFKSYVNILKKEFKHPIWELILRCRTKLLQYHSVGLDALPIPILSMDMVGLSASNVELKSDTELLGKSIMSVGLLRLSYQQWRSERQHTWGKEAKPYKPLLKVLKILEKKVLESLVESQSFDVLFKLYDSLLGSHRQLWSGLTSSDSDSILVSRRTLEKIVLKFRNFFPSEVDDYMKEEINVDHAFSGSIRSQKSLLWKHGGHPRVPSSGDIYLKQRQLLGCCELVWPNKKRSWDYVGGEAPIEVVLSFNLELRSLAMEGISISAFVEDDIKSIGQLEEMYQMLVHRLESEKKMLEARFESSRHTTWLADPSICCSFPLDLPCRGSRLLSWQAEFPILDDSSFFQDTDILHNLTRISLFDEQEHYSDLKKLMGSMKNALNFALKFSSRTPMELVPHQDLLWTVDSLLDNPAVSTRIAGYVLEMWFSWHRLLWMKYDLSRDVLNGDYANGVSLPHRLFRLMKTETIEGILKGSSRLGDFHLQSLKLRVASCDLWRGSHKMDSIKGFLLSAARSLFQKIIYAHRKSFSAHNYGLIKYAFNSFMTKNVTEDDVKALVTLLASLNHCIFNEMLDPLIQPVLKGLYMNIGAESVWLRIGCLRYHLLTRGNDLDPAAKYTIKHSQLTENITSLELDINVRRECELLAGCFQLREPNDFRASLLESLHSQQVGMRRQMVFRPDSGKFKKLKHKLDEFQKFVMSCTRWMDSGYNRPLEEMIDQVQNWQVTAANFMDHLSSEYSAYVDVVVPVQVAIHEIKLGLSLVLSSAISGKALERLGQQNMVSVLDNVYSFMRFPRKSSSRSVIVDSSSEIQWPCSIESEDLHMLERLITTGLPSVQNLKFTFYKNILQRVSHSIAEARLFDNASFGLLNKYFGEFASSWMHMKHEARKKEDDSAQMFKFKPRAFRIENVIDLDISTLGSSVDVETFHEWKEFHAAEELKHGLNNDEVYDTVAEDWSAIEDSILADVVDIHNQLFGSGVVDVPDEAKVSSFTDSYSLGIQMVRSLEGTVFSDFDAKLVPEQILRISIEHEQRFASPRKSGHVYNYYKHPNSPMMAKVVEPVVNLKQRVLVLLNEYPALQKLLDAVEMVLAIPLSTPLAKVLSGLEFLLNRFWALQEAGVKVPSLGEHLNPVFAFVSSLQKLEFESGFALLSEVQVQFEENAARLWYPLYSVLQPNIDEYTEHTIKSLNDFIDLSNIGEFKRRLQLLVAFHGQISNGVRRGCYSSPSQLETIAILYNTVGYYLQFLPKISEHIDDSRRGVEAKLKDLKKLYQWENTVDPVTIDRSRRGRKKLRTIVQEFTDLLRQPVSLFLAQEVTKHCSGLSAQSPSDLGESFENSRKLLELVHHQANLRDEERLSWFSDSLKKLDSSASAGFFTKDLEEEVTRFIKDGAPPNILLNKGTEIWDTVRTVCGEVISCCDIWKDEQKSSKKRRVFTDFLKHLESCGLSKHRSNFEETASKESGYWLLQPAYDVGHLLSKGCVDSAPQSNPKISSSGNLDSEWMNANSFYFKGIASEQVMQKTCVAFHKDFTLEQVKQCSSFVKHLLEILQDQRATAYNFADQLKDLRQCIWPLANLFSKSVSGADCVEWSFTPNQDAIFNCMWQQKQILGNLSTMMCEVRLLLQKVEKNHLNSCSSMKVSMKHISDVVETFIPGVQTLKDSLDLHLLGNNKVIADLGASLHPLGVTMQMGQLVSDIFEYIGTFEDSLRELSGQGGNEGGAVEFRIIGHFRDVFEKATELKKQYESDLEVRNQSQDMIEDGNDIEAGFQAALKEIDESISDALNGMLSETNRPVVDEESLRNICSWKGDFESETRNLKLKDLRDGLVKLNAVYGKLLTRSMKTDPRLCSHLNTLNVILEFGDGLLHDFLSMHGMVSAVAHALGDVFSSLLAKGYGTPEDQEIESDTKQDAAGTGMGEGTGVNDVSEQIEDEDQLVGLSEKPDEKQDGESDAPSKDDKGIEVGQDFEADTHSVSEDSGDENEDDEEENPDEQLENAMGETGDSGEIAKEKPLDKNDDESPPDMNEKDESGQSIKDNGTIDKELRAKSDTAPASEAGEDVPEGADPQDEGDGDETASPDMEDANMDNKDSGALNPNEPNKWSDNDDDDDNDGDETNGTEPMESHENEELQDDGDIEMGEDQTDKSLDEEEGLDKLDEDSKTGNQEDPHENDADMDSAPQNPEDETISKSGTDPVGDDTDMPSSEPSNSLQPNAATDSGSVGPGAKCAQGNDNQQDPSSALPDSMQSELSVAGASGGGKHGNDGFSAPIPEESSNQKIRPNPLRNIGDALDSWKERVKVSTDLNEKNSGEDDANDDAADEYGYTAEFEKGTAQALGPATADQMMTERDLDNSTRIDEMEEEEEEDHVTDMEVDYQSSDKNRASGSVPNSRNALERLLEKMEIDEQPEELTECSMDLSDAAKLWKRFMLSTTRLSQELAEQLRLVMEPTLASKLQGDYKTGKRINMKKVISYIASHYRKDKIWLRRTRPNKRDYQVVIAVDDSKSMLEKKCSNFAMEALMTVCRAMSHLEVGKLAVTSFGKAGNAKVLHDFDQPFTGEAGIKMISSLTFEQDNRNTDNPMADLLKYLENMLDSAAMNARHPSGHNPLQQLVLIIGDGDFNERGLTRYVRDISNKGCMVAYLVLDPSDEIMNRLEYVFQDNKPVKSKYMDSFPFQYYAVLKKAEELPRTLADLIRQWFELMQNSRN